VCGNGKGSFERITSSVCSVCVCVFLILLVYFRERQLLVAEKGDDENVTTSKISATEQCKFTVILILNFSKSILVETLSGGPVLKLGDDAKLYQPSTTFVLSEQTSRRNDILVCAYFVMELYMFCSQRTKENSICHIICALNNAVMLK
jgi:hypothetical protein